MTNAPRHIQFACDSETESHTRMKSIARALQNCPTLTEVAPFFVITETNLEG